MSRDRLGLGGQTRRIWSCWLGYSGLGGWSRGAGGLGHHHVGLLGLLVWVLGWGPRAWGAPCGGLGVLVWVLRGVWDCWGREGPKLPG